MKPTLIIMSVLIVGIIILFFLKGINSKSGQAPGLIEGKLSQCSNKPNCVCSELKEDHKHYINPIIVPDNPELDALAVLKNVISDMGGVLQLETERYAAYQFTSAIFGFVDDLEIRFDPVNKVIHVRSASRVGTSDFGVNKKRVELLNKLFAEKISEAS